MAPSEQASTHQQQAAVIERCVPSQGGGIPEDSLDQVFQYGYTTVDDCDLSAQVLAIRRLHTPMSAQRLSHLPESTRETVLRSAGDVQVTRSLPSRALGIDTLCCAQHNEERCAACQVRGLKWFR